MRRSLLALAVFTLVGACDGAVLTGPEAEVAVRRIQPTVGERPMPLVFVDGREVAVGEAREIPTESIERVEVVKGARALRTYGERASDGVILITLKPATPPTAR
jgi:outer membrane receptor for ferrienterochelin and colicin